MPSYRKTTAGNSNRDQGNAFSSGMDPTARSDTDSRTPSTDKSSEVRTPCSTSRLCIIRVVRLVVAFIFFLVSLDYSSKCWSGSCDLLGNSCACNRSLASFSLSCICCSFANRSVLLVWSFAHYSCNWSAVAMALFYPSAMSLAAIFSFSYSLCT